MSGTGLLVTPPYAGFSTAPLSDDDKNLVRYFCGYPVYPAGVVVTIEVVTNPIYLQLEYKMNNMQPSGYQRVRFHLQELIPLDAAIAGSSSNLDTDQASVWYHNKREVRDRTRLYNQRRRTFADALGVAYGPNLAGSSGGSIACIV